MKKYFYTFTVSALSLLFGSCLDEEGVFKDNGSYGIVELVLPARSTSTPFAVKTFGVSSEEESVVVPVEVNYTGVNGAPADVEVTLALDYEIAETYAEENEVTVLPTDLYELPASATVTIPKGQKKAVYAITVDPRLFDGATKYAVAVKIVSASAGVISGNYSTGIYLLSLKGPWDGTYNVTYYWYQRGSGAANSNIEARASNIRLTTIGAGVYETANVGNYFSGWTEYTFKPDGTIGLDAYYQVLEVVSSSYDLANLTFEVDYYFFSANYHLKETYVKTGD